MAAITTLSTLVSNYFKGGRWLTRNDSSGLRQQLNGIVTKVNEVVNRLNGSTYFDTLQVGDVTGYYTSGHAWFLCDGVNPPTVSQMHFQDQSTGAFYRLFLTGGGTVTTASV